MSMLLLLLLLGWAVDMVVEMDIGIGKADERGESSNKISEANVVD